jgi:chaperone modulatory protein CbpM
MADEFELLDETTRLSAQDLARVIGVDITWIETLYSHGAISETGHYTVLTMARLRKARRLEVDLGLNTESLAVVLDLLDQIDQLHGELARHKSNKGK